MIFELTKASKFEFHEDIEIKKIQDLEKLQKQYNHPLVVNFIRYSPSKLKPFPTIQIYDDYIE